MEASNLINQLTEARKIPSSVKDMQKLISNVARKNELDNFEYLNLIPDEQFTFKFSIDTLPPGIFLKGRIVHTDEFERRYLRPHNWSVLGAKVKPRPSFLTDKIEIRISKDNPFIVKPRYLYHAAPIELENKILRQGLKPKSRPLFRLYRYSESRIYLFINYDERLIDMMMTSIERGERSEDFESRGYSVFEIDTDVFDRFNLFVDASQSLNDNVVYTKTHIPPEAIKVVHRHLWRE